jgi:hypothetical protein
MEWGSLGMAANLEETLISCLGRRFVKQFSKFVEHRVAKQAEAAGASCLARHLGRAELRFSAQYPKLARTV